MLTIDNFDKNYPYTNEEIKELVKDIDSWSDEKLLYIYTSKNDVTDRGNFFKNVVRIHKHVDKDRLVNILLNSGRLNEIQAAR